MATRANVVLEEDILTIIDGNTVILILHSCLESGSCKTPEKTAEDETYCSSG